MCAGFWSLSSAAVGRFWELQGKKSAKNEVFTIYSFKQDDYYFWCEEEKEKRRERQGKARQGKGRKREIRLLQLCVMLLHD